MKYFTTMTVGQLREALERFHDNDMIAAACDYGDLCHTQQLIGFDSAEKLQVVESAFSQSGMAVADSGDNELYDDDAAWAVVLRLTNSD